MLMQISTGSRIAIGLAIAGAIGLSVIAGYETHHLRVKARIIIMAGLVAIGSSSVYFLVTWLAQV